MPGNFNMLSDKLQFVGQSVLLWARFNLDSGCLRETSYGSVPAAIRNIHLFLVFCRIENLELYTHHPAPFDAFDLE
jgi:hypothetical protein